MATGAVLGEDIEQVVATTADAVELVAAPECTRGDARCARASSWSAGSSSPAIRRRSRRCCGEHPDASVLVCDGALSERFLEGLLAARRERAGRELQIIAGDPTKVFLSRHGPGWYARQGITLEVREPIELKAITVNPVAPESHRLDSRRLRELISEAVGDVPVLDVLDQSYPGC